MVKAVKGVNTLYLYSQRRDFGDSMVAQKYRLRNTLLRNSVLLGSQFPLDVVVQVSENQEYGLRELILERRAVNYESYFRNGGA